MQCLQCQYENASDAKFCNQCAAPFAPVCSPCGRENAADAKFCNQCGTPLVAPISALSSSASHRQGINVASRLYTVLPFVISVLQRERRVTYRMLKHVYGVDDELLAEIREELTFRRLAIDEDGKGLVWMGEAHPVPSLPVDVSSSPATADTTAFVSSPQPPSCPHHHRDHYALSQADSTVSGRVRRRPA